MHKDVSYNLYLSLIKIINQISLNISIQHSKLKLDFVILSLNYNVLDYSSFISFCDYLKEFILFIIFKLNRYMF